MRILCIGDSNTWGYNPENGLRHENRWTKVLARLLPEDEIIEEGLCGRTLVSIDNRKRERCGIESLKMILMTHKPVDLVIVMLGTNELKKIFGGGAYYIAGGIGEYIKIIKNPFQWEKFTVPKLLIISPVLVGENIVEQQGESGEFDANSLQQSKLMAAAIKNICDNYKTEFMNAAEYANPSSVDGIHMDEENHQKLANAICTKVKKILY